MAKSYKVTFILDLRNTDDDAAKVISDISDVLVKLGAQVGDTADLGVRDFARAADQRFKQGHYVEIFFSSESGNVPAELKEKLRLDKRINRIFVEA